MEFCGFSKFWVKGVEKGGGYIFGAIEPSQPFSNPGHQCERGDTNAKEILIGKKSDNKSKN